MDIPREIASARQRAGLTQAQLAERVGTSQATVSAYEAGRKQPSAETFVRLLAATGARLSVDESLREPVRLPSRRERLRRGQVLQQVIELAEALPSRPAPALRYPPIKDLVRSADAA